MQALPTEVDRLGAKRIMIVSERSTKGYAGAVHELLGERVVAESPDVQPHVPADEAGRARGTATESNADLIITIGGGSATGLGKAIVLERALGFIAIPTTYAGSEVTPVYGITEAGRKRAARDTRVLPDTVIYDPRLTTSLPARVTAGTGINALAHCVEALYAENANPIATTLAEIGIHVLNAALRACVHDPSDRSGRTEALYGAYVAGTVMASSGMALHHRICQVLGGAFGASHGDLNAIFLPYVVAFNEPAAPDAVQRVARALDVERGTPAARSLFDLARALGAPRTLHEIGMREAQLEDAADLVVGGSFYNPRATTREDVVQILEAAYAGSPPES